MSGRRADNERWVARARGQATRPGKRSAADGGQRLRMGLAVIAACVVAALVYLPALDGGFVRDDHDLIEHNPVLRDPSALGSLLRSDFWAASGTRSGMWRPAVTLSYVVDVRRDGGPRVLHLTNLALHSLTSGLVGVFAMLLGLAPGTAFVAGAWFALMPAHVETVAWSSGRTDLMGGLFCVLALILARHSRGRRPWMLVGAACSYALALLSKETAVSWFGVLAIDAWTTRDEARWRTLAPFAIVLSGYGVAHHFIAGSVPNSIWIDAHGLASRRLGAAQVVASFMGALVPGYRHVPDRAPMLWEQFSSPGVLGGCAITAALVVTLVVLVSRRSPVATPLFAFALPALLISSLAALSGYLTVADRNVYLSSSGAAWLLGLCIEWAGRRGRVMARAGFVLACLLIGVSALETRRLIPDWRDDRTLYASMVRGQPGHAEGNIGLANALVAEGRDAQAMDRLVVAERSEPRHPAVPVTRALVAAQRGDWQGELRHAERALELSPWREDALVHLISAYLHLGRAREADSVLAVRLQAGPASPTVAGLRGRVLLVEGRVEDALPLLESASRWARDDPHLVEALGEAQVRTGKVDAARESFARATELAPGSYDSWLRLAMTEAVMGHRREAWAATDRAARLPQAADGRAQALRQKLLSRWGGAPP